MTAGYLVDVDALASACRYVAREWGEESGYRCEVVGSSARRVAIEVHASDGSRFLVAADRWGNVAHDTERDGSDHAAILAVMGAVTS
jgi:hypothetical protein